MIDMACCGKSKAPASAPLEKFNVILVGNPNVGKTSLLHRFANEVFMESPEEIANATVGVDVIHKELEYNGQQVKLAIFDTGGQERYKDLTVSYYRNASVVICVFDLNNKESFTAIEGWYKEINLYCKNTTKRILVANKTDLEQVVTQEELDQAAMSYYPKPDLVLKSSAKKGENVTEVFTSWLKEVIS